MSVVICVRHPDYSNEFRVFDGDVEIIDVDLGRSDLSDPDEYAEWAEDHRLTAEGLRGRGHEAAASWLLAAVAEAEGVTP